MVFWDITPLVQDKAAFRESIKRIADHFRNKGVDVVVSCEARGFIFGAAVAYELGAGFVPIRKADKLPFKVLSTSYIKEYEQGAIWVIEVHEDAIKKGQKVLIVDDVLATGGTTKATIKLVQQLGGQIVGLGFLVALEYLPGKRELAKGYDLFTLINYDTTNG